MPIFKLKNKLLLGFGALAMSFGGFSFLSLPKNVSRPNQQSSLNKVLLNIKFQGLKMSYIQCDTYKDYGNGPGRPNRYGECEEEETTFKNTQKPLVGTRNPTHSIKKEIADIKKRIKKLGEKIGEMGKREKELIGNLNGLPPTLRKKYKEQI